MKTLVVCGEYCSYTIIYIQTVCGLCVACVWFQIEYKACVVSNTSIPMCVTCVVSTERY